jgi:hypothetical protein
MDDTYLPLSGCDEPGDLHRVFSRLATPAWLVRTLGRVRPGVLIYDGGRLRFSTDSEILFDSDITQLAKYRFHSLYYLSLWLDGTRFMFSLGDPYSRHPRTSGPQWLADRLVALKDEGFVGTDELARFREARWRTALRVSGARQVGSRLTTRAKFAITLLTILLVSLGLIVATGQY